MKLSKYMKLCLIAAFLFASWCACIYVSSNLSRTHYYFKAGLVFGIITCVIATWEVTHLEKFARREMTEANMVPFFITMFFVCISLLVNSVFIYMSSILESDDGIKAIPILFNAVTISAYLVYLIYFNQYQERLIIQLREIGEKTRDINRMSDTLGMLLVKADDPEIHKMLLSLKQMVDMGGNTSDSETKDLENEFNNLLLSIDEKLDGHWKKEEIIAIIKSAMNIWKQRLSLCH
ncbi:hypothetical protein [Oribacterium sp. P6A1]|uniref:hypothetical protein n=1 Tax=Oribacterium sp. P6A1 TaxID=1410612 RepID=UPI00055DC3E0|nr:hypothetical protein [Oribacterium sp. P6A1]